MIPMHAELGVAALAAVLATTAVVAAAPQRAPPRSGRRFYVVAAVVAIVLSIAAFAPSIVYQAERRGALTPLVAAHGAFMAAWLALFLAQTWLVANRHVGLHKRLGLASIPVAGGVVVTGYAATVAMARRGYDLSGDLSRPSASAMDNTVFQFGAVLIFTVLVAAALILRRRPEAHKRLMTLAVIQTLMAAPLAHLVGHFRLPGLLVPAWGVAVALTLMLHDRRALGRIHPVSLWGGLGLVVVNNLQFAVIGPSRTWQGFVAWLAN